MTAGSLYTGRAAGFDLAAEWAGIEVLWQVEKDKKAHQFLQKNFPTVKRHYDTKEVGSHNLQPVDIIFGGFPCQPFSTAGKRKGTADHRHQWPQFKRIVAELRPPFILAENVDGITSIYQPTGSIQMEDKETITYEAATLFLEVIRQDLESLGYQTDFYCIPASALGALHIRYRGIHCCLRRMLPTQQATDCRATARAATTWKRLHEQGAYRYSPHQWPGATTAYRNPIGYGMANATWMGPATRYRWT